MIHQPVCFFVRVPLLIITISVPGYLFILHVRGMHHRDLVRMFLVSCCHSLPVSQWPSIIQHSKYAFWGSRFGSISPDLWFPLGASFFLRPAVLVARTYRPNDLPVSGAPSQNGSRLSCCHKRSAPLLAAIEWLRNGEGPCHLHTTCPGNKHLS